MEWIHLWIGLDWVGPEKWTHVQLWYVSHYQLVNLDYFILTESHKTKSLLSKFPGSGEFQISGVNFPLPLPLLRTIPEIITA